MLIPEKISIKYFILDYLIIKFEEVNLLTIY